MRTMIYTQFKSGMRVLMTLLVLAFHMQTSAQKDRTANGPQPSALDERWKEGGVFAGYNPEDELLHLRTENSKTFKNSNGTNSALFVGAVHYKDVNGFWQDIDKSIIPSSKTGYAFENVNNSIKTYFPATSTGSVLLDIAGNQISLWNQKKISIERNGQLVSSVEYSNVSPQKVNSNEIMYNNVVEGLNEQFYAIESGIKYNTILATIPSLTSSAQENDEIYLAQTLYLNNGYSVLVDGEVKNSDFECDHFSIGLLGMANTLDFGDITILTNSSINSDSDFIKQNIETKKAENNGVHSKYSIRFISSNVLEIRVIIPMEIVLNQSLYPIVVDPSITVGSNTLAYSGVFDGYYSDTKNQFIYLSSELVAAGLANGSLITAIGVYNSAGSGQCNNGSREGCSLSLRSTASSAHTSTTFNNDGYTNCYAGTITPSTNSWITCTFSTNYTFNSALNLDLQAAMNQTTFDCNFKFNYFGHYTVSGNRNLYVFSYLNDIVPLTHTGTGTYGSELLYIKITYSSPPTVTTTVASSIGNFTASSGGNVTSEGEASVTARGVLWGTSPGLSMPSANSTSNGSGTGSFTSSLTGLSVGTVYYYRAYALNSVGYGYGTELSFVTTGPSAEGYYISGNIENNGTIVSTSDENYLRMTGGTSDATKKTISGNGTFTDSKLFADGYIQYTGSHSGKFNETFVNTSKNLVVADNKTFPNGTMSNYGTLTLDGTGIITNTGSVINGGTLTVASTGEITVAGTWTNNGTFTPGSGQVSFDGSSNSIIGGSSAISFYKLKMNKGTSSATTTLAADATVTNTLTLTTGKMDLTSFILTIGNSSATGSISGGSSSSYIVAYDNETTIGKVRRYVSSAASTAYSFPIGDATNYTPLTYTNVSGTAGSGAYLDVYTKATKIPQLHSSITNYTNRYWEVAPTGITSPNYSITYTYVTGDVVGSQASFVPVKYSSGTWYKPTNSVFTDGTAQGTASGPTSNTVTWSDLSTFSQFSVAGSVASPLPIELTNFQANCSENNTVDVTWSTASEHNTNYFRLDKSRDGSNWDVLNTIGAAGNSNYVIDYALTDAFPNPGINYYRLTQYDNDGVFETFGVQAAVCKDQQAGTALSSYPNPSSGDFNVDLQTDELEGEATLLITDAKGAVVHSQDIKIIKGNNNFVIQKFNAEPGIYYISVRTATGTITTKHSMR